MDELRTALDRLRRDTEERLRALEQDRLRIVDASHGDNADDEHDPEGQTIAWDREQTAALLRDARERLAEVGRARTRLESGWDGRCSRCARVIPVERLLARPTTERCVACA